MSSTINSLKLLTDPIRLRMILLLKDETLSVAEMQSILGLGQSGVSTKLAQLKKEGLVELKRSGKNSLYKARVSGSLLRILEEMAKEVPELAQDQRALRFSLDRRGDRARAYFDELAGRFGREYVPGRSWKGLAEGLLRVMNYEVVADLGAGEGTLSQLLAQRAKKVIAVDNSEKMVEFGQKLARQNKLPHLEYRLGDLEKPPIESRSVDLAFFSQALHHARDPQEAIHSAYKILKKGGALVVLDLLQHQFDQARELYHDHWLGFSEVEMVEMLEAAGFSSCETAVVDREDAPPYFQTILATATK